MKKSRFLHINLLAFLCLSLLLAPAASVQAASKQNTSFSCQSVIEIPSKECEALVLLYQIGHENNRTWTHQENWLDNNTPSTWYGVSVSQGHVEELKLHENQLRSYLPAQLSDLSQLQTLDLSQNYLYGTIPPEIGSLSHLAVLNLTNNTLSGFLPAELGNLSALTQLDLSYNQFNGHIPASLGNLSNLSQLRLNQNQFDGIIPKEFGNLSNLSVLDLRHLYLVGPIPPEVGELSQLTQLHLSYNSLNGRIPTGLGNLTNLEELYLEHNHFYGDLPVTFGQLINLKDYDGLEFWDNHLSLSSLPPETVSFLQSKSQNFYNYQTNQLTYCASVTEIPQKECEALLAFYNSTRGEVWQSKPTNWLSNTTPSTWSGITITSGHVTGLVLGPNSVFGGALPSELGDLTSLTQLDLSNNNLQGVVPQTLLQLTALADITGLKLNNNRLSTPASSPELAAFLEQKNPGWQDNQAHFFTDCSMVTEIPQTECEALVSFYHSTLGYTWEYQGVWLQNNQPSTWSGITIKRKHVANLFFGDKHLLRGSLPPELNAFYYLTDLDLSDNMIGGTIPPELGDFPKLLTLDLANNQLTGVIPPELGKLSTLVELSLYHNQLNGTLPVELSNLQTLSYLILGENQFSGSIPPEYGQMPYLNVLSLEANQLSGSIPPELSELFRLSSINLSDNNLSGDIPNELSKFNNLDPYNGINLGFNYLNTSGLSSELSDYLELHSKNWQNTQPAYDLSYQLVDEYPVINWKSEANPDFLNGYTIYRDGQLLVQVNPSVKTYRDTTIQYGQTYHYIVKKVNKYTNKETKPSKELAVNIILEPGLTALSAYNAPAGSPALTLNLTGSQFTSGSIVRWNGSDLATTFVSATRLSAVVPADKLASAGSASVTVYNPAPHDKLSGPLAFLIQPAANLETNSALLSPTQPGTLTFTSAANPALSASLSAPAGAVTAQTQLFFTSTPAQPGALQSGFLFGGQHFEINAFVDGQKQANFQFAQPVRLTLTYPSSLSELEASKLELRYWNGSQWSTGGINLVSRDPAKHQLVVELTHLSEFALLTSGYRTFTPLITK